MRRTLAGDSDGYFATVDGSVASIAKTAKRGWWRGSSDTTGIDYFRFIYCIQNHDQIGNRALGRSFASRLLIGLSIAQPARCLLLLPQTPLLFMGQEWAASTPFLYFTDHHDELGSAVTKGRRQEFGFIHGLFWQAEIPDPQALRNIPRQQASLGRTDHRTSRRHVADV